MRFVKETLDKIKALLYCAVDKTGSCFFFFFFFFFSPLCVLFFVQLWLTMGEIGVTLVFIHTQTDRLRDGQTD